MMTVNPAERDESVLTDPNMIRGVK